MENDHSSVKNIGDNHIRSMEYSTDRFSYNSEIKEAQIMETSIKNTTLASQNSIVNSSTNNSSPKMGSRRIFTPQFKLQVLESYRNDSDCKGNQRATARKYNIHRRQIQKWLQCESSLRSSVENINHNTVKHQFHNISVQQQQSQKLSMPDSSSVSGSYGPSQHSAQLSLDSTRSMMVPSLATGMSSSSNQAHGVFAAANIAAAVAAAAVAGAAGSIAITSSSSSTTTSAPTKAVVSPLRPSAFIGASRNTSATMSPLLHHHHYGIPPYTHAPAGAPLSVPILTHHISHPQHIHQQTQQPHQSYQYHNLAYTQILTHQPEKQQSSFLTSVSLPTISVLSAATSASLPIGFAKREIENTDGLDALQLRITTSSEILTENNGYVYNDDHKNIYTESKKCTGFTDPTVHAPFSAYQFKNDGYPLLFPICPIDLSLRSRQEMKPELLTNVKSNVNSYEQNGLNGETSIVDLTYRKRKVANISNTGHDFKQEFPEKQAKLVSSQKEETTKYTAYNASEFCSENVPNTGNCTEEDDGEIEVGTEDKVPPYKPVKLFKPYLLDDYGDNDNFVNSSNKCTENEVTESSDKSTWVSSARSISPTNCYSDMLVESCCDTTFQPKIRDKYSNLHESSNFLAEIKTACPRSAFNPATSVSTLSTTTFQCPKGSPASSGYESSSSTYSESSLSSRSEAYGQTYSISLQMHTIDNDNIVLHPSKHVQRWLDHEESNPPAPNSSIALFV